MPISGPNADPLAALLAAPQDGVLAVITGVDGPSYRPLGARMAIDAAGNRVGTLSSGCIENDIALHAAEALASGKMQRLRYGTGSPFRDIQLPCGGGLEITLVPAPDRAVLAAAKAAADSRQVFQAALDLTSGALGVVPLGAEASPGQFILRITPDPHLIIFGKGPEASTFAALAQSTGYPNILISPDEETLGYASAKAITTRHITRPELPSDLKPDRWSAIVLFFHDHEWEPPILAAALESDAFYVGAQGSLRAAQARREELARLGVPSAQISRLKGPIGLVPSVRDARTLAVSVLAEILALDPDRNTR